MPNSTATELLTVALGVAQTMSAGIQKGEMRQNVRGSTDALISSTPLLIVGGDNAITELKKRPDHLVRIPVRKRISRSAGTVRTCATSTAQGDTALVTPTWATITDGFKVNLSTSYGNMYSFEQQYQNEFEQCMRILHDKIETDNLTFFEANKATIAGQVGTMNTWNTLNGQMQVSLAKQDQYFGSIYSEMRQNRYSGPYSHIHTLGQMEFEISRQTAQGAGNSTNLAWQSGLGWNHYASQALTGPTGTTGTSYVFEPGTVGLLNWIRPDFRAGKDIGQKIWSKITDPLYPQIEWEMMVSLICGDGNDGNTGGVGYENAQLVSFEFSADFSRMARYTSTPGDTGIMKYSQMAV